MATLEQIHLAQSDPNGLAIVFVHGLGGHPHHTWMANEKDLETLWPKWIGTDAACATWVLAYDATLSSWRESAMQLTDQGNAVLDLLASEPRLNTRPLILIGHSLGGLVIKTAIAQGMSEGVQRYKDVVRRVRGIVFVATPHKGSELARLAAAIALLLQTNPQVGDIKIHDANLLALHNRFLAVHQDLAFAVRTFAETRKVVVGKRFWGIPLGKILGVPLGRYFTVVDPSSAEPHVPRETAVPLPEDHFSICKPKSRDAQIHKSLLGFIETIRAVSPAPNTAEMTVESHNATSVLSSVASDARPGHDEPIPSDDELVAPLFGFDPVAIARVTTNLKSRPDLLDRIIEQIPKYPFGDAAVRELFHAHPKQSADILMGRIKKIERRSDSWEAREALFDPCHASDCENELVTLATGVKKGGQRKVAIEALGRCGNSNFGYDLCEFLLAKSSGGWNLEDIEKKSILDALTRMFVRSANELSNVTYAGEKLLKAIIHVEKLAPEIIGQSSVQEILWECDGRHADALIQTWLKSDSNKAICLASSALGIGGIVRAVEPLIEVMKRSNDEGALLSCSEALGSIASKKGIDWLLAQPPDSKARLGLVYALDQLEDSSVFRDAVTEAKSKYWGKYEPRCLILTAVGRRRADEFAPMLQESLVASGAFERGVATLALARIGKIASIDAKRMVAQAANDEQHLFTSLAVLSLDPSIFPALADRIRKELGSLRTYDYLPGIQKSIQEVLLWTSNAEAIDLANAWKPYYSPIAR